MILRGAPPVGPARGKTRRIAQLIAARLLRGLTNARLAGRTLLAAAGDNRLGPASADPSGPWETAMGGA